MDAATFNTVKSALDAELDALQPNAGVGIKLGWELYSEFRRRGLLMPKKVDMILDGWVQPSYRDKYVYDDFVIGELEYRVGVARA